MKQNIHIEFDPEKGSMEVTTDTGYRIDDLMTVLFTYQLKAMQDFIESIPEKDKQEVKEYVYDQYNAGASNVLYLFAPDKELHPDLTVEAMKEAEDRYMYNQLNREARRDLDKKTKGATKDLKVLKGGK